VTADPLMQDVGLLSGHDGFRLGARHLAARGPRKGGVVVLQEVFGVTPHIKSVMVRLSSSGYETIAPSLFDRIAPNFALPADAEGLAAGIAAARSTPNVQAVADITAALHSLAPGPKFAVGFCFGGVMAWLAAQYCEGLAGSVCFYGRRIIDQLDAPLKAPVMMHYGDRDANIPLSDVASIQARYAEADIHLYPAGHAFCRDDGENYDAASCDLAFARTLRFMDAIGAVAS
jgi:carboxymethylenebutenolidase